MPIVSIWTISKTNHRSCPSTNKTKWKWKAKMSKLKPYIAIKLIFFACNSYRPVPVYGFNSEREPTVKTQVDDSILSGLRPGVSWRQVSINHCHCHSHLYPTPVKMFLYPTSQSARCIKQTSRGKACWRRHVSSLLWHFFNPPSALRLLQKTGSKLYTQRLSASVIG